MTYATSTRYLQRFGLDEAAMLLADEQRLLTKELLQQAMAGVWATAPAPAPTAEQQAAATDALDRLQRQLVAASNYMDGYLRTALTLPISAADANIPALEDCCLALTRDGLADDPENSTERVAAQANTWRTWLRDVSTHKVELVTAAGTAPAGESRFHFGQAASGFAWDRFGGVR